MATETLESALLTTEDNFSPEANKINEFNAVTIYLDGEEEITTLDLELRKAANVERSSLKCKSIAVIACTMAMLGCILSIIFFELFTNKIAGILLVTFSIIVLLSTAISYRVYRKKGDEYFSSEWRNGLKFDKVDKEVKVIEFRAIYGVDDAGDSSLLKYANVHEANIEVRVIKDICAFNKITNIGAIHTESGSQLYIGYAIDGDDATETKWSSNVLMTTNTDKRYLKLRSIVKNMSREYSLRIAIDV